MKKSIFISLVCFLISANAFAEWDEWGNASVIYENDSANILVRKDATSVATAESVILLQNRKGVENFGVSTHSYNKKSEKVTVLSAETINGKTSVPVDLEKLEDKPRASSLSGFDDINQIKLVFPALREGSRVHEKWTFEILRPKVPGFYSNFFSFGWNPEKTSRYVIDSEIPLYYLENDPENSLSIVQRNENGRSHIEIALKKPNYRQVMNESNAGLNAKAITWVIISSEKNWEDLAKKIVPLYEERLKAPLPTRFAAIAKNASKGKTVEEKINRAILQFSPGIHYQGDWRPVEGSYVPRPLAEIAKTGYGDCKDFAAAMTAILRSIGLAADVAWVRRDKIPPTLDSPIPYYGFNHAIIHIVADGQDLWLDPTNEFRQIEVIPNDIAARNALILNPEKPELRFIAKENSDQNQVCVDKSINPGKDEMETVDISETFTGSAAYGWNASILFDGLNFAMRTRKDVMDAGYPVDDFKMVKMDKLNLNNLFSFKDRYRYRARDFFYRTNAGRVYIVGTPASIIDDLLAVDESTRRADFIAEKMRKITTTVHFLDRKIANAPMLGCNIVSPWLDLKRSFQQTPEGLTLTDVILVKEKRIPVEKIKSSEFSSFKRDIRSCFKRVGLVFEDREK